MTYPPKITEKDRKVLAIVARGHLDRKMTATRGGISSQVSALTWNEIQVALNVPFGEISDSIAHLVANNYIDSGRQNPTFWGKIKGEPETAYFWLTPEGEKFLQTEQSHPSEPTSDGLKSTSGDLTRVEDSLKQLGYDITPYGVGVALLSLESGYNNVETASHLALATLARDAKEAGHDIVKLIALVPHARAMVDILSKCKEAGLMREELFKNDARAMLKVVIVDKDQPVWIERVLSDQIVSQDRVAFSRINYSEMTG